MRENNGGGNGTDFQPRSAMNGRLNKTNQREEQGTRTRTVGKTQQHMRGLTYSVNHRVLLVSVGTAVPKTKLVLPCCCLLEGWKESKLRELL